MNKLENLTEAMNIYMDQTKNRTSVDNDYSDHGNHSDSYNDAATTYQYLTINFALRFKLILPLSREANHKNNEVVYQLIMRKSEKDR